MSIQTKTMTVKSDTSLAETTTTIRDTVTFDVSNMPNGITYKGLKAVLSFAEPIQWNKASTYDALTVVWDDASHGSYASKRRVPANIELTNEFYWLRTADLDAQVEMYRQEVQEMDGRVTANEQAIATVSNWFNEEFHVGSKQQFKTINAALNACFNAGGGTIIIHSGTYNESIVIPSHKATIPIAFIGTSRDTVIWKSETYGYKYPCFSGSGDFTFSNITFIKGTPNGSSNSKSVNDGGYALHFDTPDAQGTVKVNNCIAISYENCGIGCGTRINQGIYISNTHIKSITDKSYSTHGCFIYHTALDRTNQTGQMISLINNTFEYIGNHSVPFTVWNNGTNDVDIHPVFINNAFVFKPTYKNYYDYSGTFTNTSPGKLILDEDKCFGNSIGYFNSNGNSQAVNHNGLAITYVNSGIKPKAALITSNDANLMPANSTFGGFMESDLIEGYDVSLVLDVISGDTYTKAGNANAKWKNIKDLSPIIKVTDLLNPEISNGFISYAKNIAPTNEDYAGIVISPSLKGYRFYFAFKLLTGDLYKNTIISNTPSGWTKINAS